MATLPRASHRRLGQKNMAGLRSGCPPHLVCVFDIFPSGLDSQAGTETLLKLGESHLNLASHELWLISLSFHALAKPCPGILGWLAPWSQMNSEEGHRDSVTQQDFSVLGQIRDSQAEMNLGIWITAALRDNRNTVP